MNKKYTVFVSSTYEDLKEERQEVMQALLEMDCIPCAMELFPASDDEQLDFIKGVIDDCDYYVLILGGKYGSLGASGLSYTELEFRYALEKGIPIISFVHNDIDSLANYKCEHDKDVIEKLNIFRLLVTQRLCKFWTSKEQLSGLVSRSMIQLIKRHPAIGWVRANQITNEKALMRITELYEENRVLKSNSERDTNIQLFSSGKDSIDVTFKIYNRGITKFEVDSLSIKMTWDDILRQIGPILIDEHPRFSIEESMCEVGIVKYFELLKEPNKILDFKNNQYIKLSERSSGEILIQFLALNYIEVKHPNHNNDYDLSRESTYVLTEQGRDTLIKLVAKRI